MLAACNHAPNPHLFTSRSCCTDLILFSMVSRSLGSSCLCLALSSEVPSDSTHRLYSLRSLSKDSTSYGKAIRFYYLNLLAKITHTPSLPYLFHANRLFLTPFKSLAESSLLCYPQLRFVRVKRNGHRPFIVQAWEGWSLGSSVCFDHAHLL